jgi:MotA/TolQ/ExbB proton channel family
MLGYTVFVVVRFSRLYYLARHESCALLPDSVRASRPGYKRLVAGLSRGVETLKSIAAAAPFLGLAGTSYGILEGFYRLGYTKYSGVGSIAADIGGALVTTAMGLIVAGPAAVSYNVLRTRLEKFESRPSGLLEAVPRSYGLAQTLSLRGRFSGMPAFALIAAPILGILIPLFALILRPPTPVGLPVHVLKISSRDHDLPTIIVSVIATNGSVGSVLYVNSQETSWDELGNTLRRQLEVRPHWVVYVEGEDYASWQDVENVIDVARGLHAEVVLLTAAPRIDSSRRSKAKTRKQARVR